MPIADRHDRREPARPAARSRRAIRVLPRDSARWEWWRTSARAGTTRSKPNGEREWGHAASCRRPTPLSRSYLDRRRLLPDPARKGRQNLALSAGYNPSDQRQNLTVSGTVTLPWAFQASGILKLISEGSDQGAGQGCDLDTRQKAKFCLLPLQSPHAPQSSRSSRSVLLVPSTASATWSIIAVDRRPDASSSRRRRASTERRVPDGRAGRRRARQGRGGVPGERGQHAREPDAGVPRAAEGHGPEADSGSAERGSRVPVAAVRHSRSCRAAAPAIRASRNGYVSQDIQGRVPGTDIYYSIQGNILRPGEVVPNAVKAFLDEQGRDHRSRDGGDGSGRRVGRRQPLHVPAPAGRRSDAGESVRRQDVAHRVHPDVRPGRHERRLAQQREVRDVHHRRAAVAAEYRPRAGRDQSRARI